MAMAVAALRKGDCDYAIVTCVNIPQDKDFHLSLVRSCSPRNKAVRHAYRGPMTNL